MSLDQPDKLSSSDAPTRTAAGDEIAPGRRARPKVWPAETGESFDTFSTPSEAAETGADPIPGPEPAVFGGINPDQDETEELNEPLGTPLEEAVRGNELIPEAPRIEWYRVIRSTWFLLASMIILLVGGTFVVWLTIPTETYVQTSIRFNQYDRLTEEEKHDLQLEMSQMVRTFPLRKTAWEVLQKKSPNVTAGFLNSGLTFHRVDAITWLPDGTLRLRVMSTEPGDDITRLAALVDAFHKEMVKRDAKLDQYKSELEQQKTTLARQQQQDQALKGEIDSLLPEAQEYSDRKQAMQAMERYLELADESNPLRLVARQNLEQLMRQVSEARELSVQRDTKLGERVTLLKEIDATQQEIARLARAIDVFVFASPPNDKALTVYDTRGTQKLIMRGMWVLIILSFGGLVVSLHLIDARAAEALRRERRELLKKSKLAAKTAATAS